MIIKIEDAPAVKHIKIDIDFTGDGEAKTTIVQETETISDTSNTKIAPASSTLVPRDTSLNLDEDFTQESEEEVQMPVIVEEEREAKVASEMNDMEI